MPSPPHVLDGKPLITATLAKMCRYIVAVLQHAPRRLRNEHASDLGQSVGRAGPLKNVDGRLLLPNRLKLNKEKDENAHDDRREPCNCEHRAREA